jgi:hypothetical protein
MDDGIDSRKIALSHADFPIGGHCCGHLMDLIFGTFVMFFQNLFTAPLWQSFSLLAYAWALAFVRHTITLYL